MTCRIIRRY